MILFICFMVFLVALVLFHDPKRNWKPLAVIGLFYLTLIYINWVPIAMDGTMMEESAFVIEPFDINYRITMEDRQVLLDILLDAKAYRQGKSFSWSGENYAIHLYHVDGGFGGRIVATEGYWYYSSGTKTYKLKVGSKAFETLRQIHAKYQAINSTAKLAEGVSVDFEKIKEDDHWLTYRMTIGMEDDQDFIIDSVMLWEFSGPDQVYYGEPITKVFQTQVRLDAKGVDFPDMLKIRGRRLDQGQWVPVQINYKLTKEEVL